MMDLGQLVTPGTGLVAIIAAVAAAARWLRPRWRRFTAKVEQLFESVNGRPEIRNPADGKLISPSVPGIGVRMTNVEDAVALLVANGQRLDNHEGRITKLEEAALERIVSRADSALGWAAVKAAVENGGEPDGEDEAEPPSLEDRDTEL